MSVGEVAWLPSQHSGGCGRVDQFVDACRCHPGQLPLAEIAQFEFSEDFALEQRVCGVRNEYLPRLGGVAEHGDAERLTIQVGPPQGVGHGRCGLPQPVRVSRCPESSRSYEVPPESPRRRGAQLFGEEKTHIAQSATCSTWTPSFARALSATMRWYSDAAAAAPSSPSSRMTRRQPAMSMASSVAMVPATVLMPSGGNSDGSSSASSW